MIIHHLLLPCLRFSLPVVRVRVWVRVWVRVIKEIFFMLGWRVFSTLNFSLATALLVSQTPNCYTTHLGASVRLNGIPLRSNFLEGHFRHMGTWCNTIWSWFQKFIFSSLGARTLWCWGVGWGLGWGVWGWGGVGWVGGGLGWGWGGWGWGGGGGKMVGFSPSLVQGTFCPFSPF